MFKTSIEDMNTGFFDINHCRETDPRGCPELDLGIIHVKCHNE